MRVALITGIAGQTGSYLAEQMLGTGWQVHGVARSADRGDESFGEAILHNVDLLDNDSIDVLIGQIEPDAVFNLAAISSVAESWKSPLATAQVNAAAVAALLASVDATSQRIGKRIAFVQASSAEMFGNASEVPQNELTRIAPTNPYGAAKAYAHHLVGVYRAKGLAASSCILYNHESPRRPTGFVTRKITSTVARITAGTERSLVLGNLDARRDWGWAPDYADALLRSAREPEGGDFVIATGVQHSIREFAELAFAAAGIDNWEDYVSTSEEFSRPTDAPVLVGDASKARKLLGWSPTVPFEEIVQRMVEADAHHAAGHS